MEESTKQLDGVIDEQATSVAISDTLTPEAAKEMIQKEREGRTTQCMSEINQLLDKYDCTLDVKMTLGLGTISPQVSIVAKN